MTQTSISRYFNALDSFRGICALIVAMSHFNGNSIFDGSPLFDRGSVYVDFFFVLSGFVIFSSYGQRLVEGYSLRKFIWLRFWRLYPLHISVFLAFVIVDLFQMLVHVDGAALYAPFSAPGESVDVIVANVFLVQSLHVVDHVAFNGPSWSISAEFYTYILFGLVLFFSPRFYRIILVTMAISFAVIVYTYHGNLFAKLDFGYFRCVYGFMCGVFAYEVFSRLVCWGETLPKRIFDILEVLVFSLVVIYLQFFAYNLASMAVPLIFSVLVLLFAFEKGIISSFLKTKPLLFLGMLSYSIYMVHMFVSGKFFALPLRLIEKLTGHHYTVIIDSIEHYGTNLWFGTFLELFYLCIVVACSYVSYRLIENPFRIWSKRVLKNRENQPAI
ncbi:MAG: acyltransferase [Alphaproteobacteria bacterium]|nr:acyltransferase [Alphaproteobacteria bacterium]MCB1550453.1 acyltransferase [Alphaproteobacteria bacterium]HPQ50129.1 acyltransferase [Alphaproteobacteria bacterium]